MEFSYKAVSDGGKIVYGSLDGIDASCAAREIRALGFTPVDIVEKRALFSYKNPLVHRISEKDKVLFFRQFATMTSAGISLSESLDLLTTQTENRCLSRAVSEISVCVKAGQALSDAMAVHAKIFPAMVFHLIRTGEESGRLDDILLQLSDALERRAELRQKIITALLYPATVILIALAVMCLLIAVVVPQFEIVFSNLNAEMPKLTQYAFRFGNFTRRHIGSAAFLLFPLFLLAKFCCRFPVCKKNSDRLVLALPIFGDICRLGSYARSFAVMELMLASGVSIADALELAGKTASNSVIKNDFQSVREGVILGIPMHTAMANGQRFSPIIRHMIAVGEETGKVETMCAKLAWWYGQELSEKVKRLTVLLEPVVVVLVGLVVAFMAFSVFLPILSSIQHLI